MRIFSVSTLLFGNLARSFYCILSQQNVAINSYDGTNKIVGNQESLQKIYFIEIKRVFTVFILVKKRNSLRNLVNTCLFTKFTTPIKSNTLPPKVADFTQLKKINVLLNPNLSSLLNVNIGLSVFAKFNVKNNAARKKKSSVQWKAEKATNRC